jgi:cysteine desulfuration protein SufE
MSVTPADNEQKLLEMFLPLPDPHERLSLIMDACAGSGLPLESRADMDLVGGCVSRVWVRRAAGPERLQLEWDAESPLVRGLGGLLCLVYQGTAPHELPGFHSRILQKLDLDRQLSPTRLRGLAALEEQIHRLAKS